jgi:hypothetical protein
MLLAATMTWSCTDDAGGPVAIAPDPGFLTVELTAPAANGDIGVLLELKGPGIETVRAPGFELYESAAPDRHLIVVAGPLSSGPLLQFRVPDRHLRAQYQVRIVEVATGEFGLAELADYGAALH